MRRRSKIGILVVCGLLFLSLLALYVSEILVRKAVERVGSASAKVAVTLQDVEISLFAGRAVFERLAITNPSRYQSPIALSIRSVVAQFDWRTLASDHVIIPDLLIEGPDITLEGSLRDNNLETIRKNLLGAADGSSAPASGAGRSTSVVIRRLRIVDARVNLRLRTGSIETKVDGFRVKNITLENLGDPDRPLSMADVAAQVVGALTQETASSIGKAAGGLIGKGAEESGKTVDRVYEGLKRMFSK